MTQNVVLLRFNDHATDALVRPVDDAGGLAPLVKTGAAYPDIAEAAVGFGRTFSSSSSDGLSATDLEAGATLLTRNASIQAIIRWDVAAAAAYGSPQTIYARGKGSAAAEYVGAGLELRVVDPVTGIGEVRWIWQTVAGVLKTQIGGHFRPPADGYLLISATRRWVSPTRVVLRYFLGDALLAEVESVDGDIGGGTTGTTTIGTRYVAGAPSLFLDGTIDELRVCDDELAPEEIVATWRRITIEQPRGYRLVRDMHDPGFPISQDPASRAQRETRLWGHALGYAAAQAENVRANILPDRAYGDVLERWETMTKRPAMPGDDLDLRRARVVGKIRQKRGVSIPGIGDALAGVASLLDTDADNLEIVAFDQTTRDDWTTLNEQRWRHMPAASWTIVGAHLRGLVAGGTAAYMRRDWRTSLQPVGGYGRGAIILSKFTPTTIAADGLAGIVHADLGAGNFVFIGLRNNAGAYELVTQTITGGVEAAVVVRATPGLVTLWLKLERDDNTANVVASYSTVSQSGPWTDYTVATGFTAAGWAGFLARSSVNGSTPAIDVALDDTIVRAPYGDRTSRFYVVRDPALPGSPDYDGAQNVLDGLKQAHTRGYVVRSLSAVYTDGSYAREPMGGI